MTLSIVHATRGGWLLALLLMLPVAVHAAAEGERPVGLFARGQGMVVDGVRARVHVSVPSRNEVVTFDLERLAVVRRTPVGAGPGQLLLSVDGRSLYVAHEGEATVGVVNLDTYAVRRLHVAAATRGESVAKVMEVAPGDLLVVPGDSNLGFAEVALVSADGSQPARAASTFDWNQQLVADPVRQLAYSLSGSDGFSTSTMRRYEYDPSTRRFRFDGSGTGSAASFGPVALSPDGRLVVSSDSRLSATGTLDSRLPLAGFPGLEPHVAFSADGQSRVERVLADHVNDFGESWWAVETDDRDVRYYTRGHTIELAGQFDPRALENEPGGSSLDVEFRFPVRIASAMPFPGPANVDDGSVRFDAAELGLGSWSFEYRAQVRSRIRHRIP